MLHHRWQEAAEYMASYTQILEDRNKIKAQPKKEVGWLVFNYSNIFKIFFM